MAKTLDLQDLGEQLESIPLPEGAPPPFIGVLDLFPQISWREGLPHGDEEGGRVHDKGKVHGRGPWQGAASPKLEKPPSSQDGGLALLGLVVRPTVTSPLEASDRRSPYHQSGNSWSSFV